ncbi:MAG: dipeptide ABC transporter ATP-binding protein [SAR324 cluster bacterium]|nr:dipeptide ABC transporter ATP-binding protein [SAR324 cluster bacterium]
MSEYLLEVKDLKKHFAIFGGIFLRQIATVFALDGISFGVKQGETVGLVGESGCGKTTLGRTLLRLYNPTAGEIHFKGQDITSISQSSLQNTRREMQMIFQDPYESLNSRHTVRQILEEPFLIHQIGTTLERKKRIDHLLEVVGLPASAKDRYPHEFSGGQRQRIGIARAIALDPQLVVCDEPVSALDVSIQSQILNLLLELQERLGLTYIFIAHDLSVVKHISDRIIVMYLGHIVEMIKSTSIVENPLHPYTQALVSAIPIADPTVRKEKIILQGDVPSPIKPPRGCRFHTRCIYVQDICRTQFPELKNYSETEEHRVACHFAGELGRH